MRKPAIMSGLLDFEDGFVGLSLPAAPQFPIFSGGWASRGARVPGAVAQAAFEGRLSMRIASRPADPLQLIQDLPVNSPAYGMRVVFLIEQGSQTVRLLNAWDRGEPDSGIPAFAAGISTSGISFTTPAGSWRVDADISALEWHAMSVIADPRSGTQNVRLDGLPLIELPGVSERSPSTIVLGGSGADAGVIRAAVAVLEIAAQPAILDRLSAARAALDRGSTALALPELGVARNMLGTTALATENLRRALAELIELIEASG